MLKSGQARISPFVDWQRSEDGGSWQFWMIAWPLDEPFLITHPGSKKVVLGLQVSLWPESSMPSLAAPSWTYPASGRSEIPSKDFLHWSCQAHSVNNVRFSHAWDIKHSSDAVRASLAGNCFQKNSSSTTPLMFPWGKIIIKRIKIKDKKKKRADKIGVASEGR